MELDIEKDRFTSLKKLSNNNDFFKNVFKKTERISSVVFYILSYMPEASGTAIHRQALSDRAMGLHETALGALALHEYEAREGLYTLMQSLVALESTIRLAVSARALTQDAALVLLGEIDAVERYLNNHFLDGAVAGSAPALTRVASSPRPTATAPARPRRERRVIPSNDLSSDALRVQQAMPDRSTRIKTVLEAAGEASIKDLSDVIRDVSEKTIQRELNSLIENGEVIREGERRWSRYRLAGAPVAE